jgi:uroporphyrinogen-III synthase
VITRSEDRGEGLARQLGELGARVISIPVIRFAPPEDAGPVRDALRRLPEFRWILFTSATAVHFFFQEARASGIPPEAFASKRFGVVGPATAAALSNQGLKSERIAAAGDSTSLAAALCGPQAKEPLGSTEACLVPQADIARPELAQILRSQGVPITTVTVYRTLAEDPERVRPFLQALEGEEGIDGIAFASPSAVRSFLSMTHPHGEHAIREKPICVFSIGPTTSAAIRERGLQVAREAAPHTVEALIRAMVAELGPPPLREPFADEGS